MLVNISRSVWLAKHKVMDANGLEVQKIHEYKLISLLGSSWTNTKQSIITLSSIEADYIPADKINLDASISPAITHEDMHSDFEIRENYCAYKAHWCQLLFCMKYS